MLREGWMLGDFGSVIRAPVCTRCRHPCTSTHLERDAKLWLQCAARSADGHRMPDFIDPAWLQADPTIPMAALMGALVGFEILRKMRRRGGLEEAARQLGLLYQRKGTIGPEPFFHFPLFRGTSGAGRLANIARGGDVIVFDYSYPVRSDNRHSVTRQTVAAHRIVGELPAFGMRPEGFVSRINEMLGASDIDFDADPRFSKRYQLAGKEESAIRELFHDDLRNRFAQGKPWYVEASGKWLIFYRKGKTIGAADLADFINETQQLAQAFVH